MLCSTVLPRMSGNSEFTVFFDEQRRKQILTGIFSSYYHANDRPIVFDTNRSWTGKMALLGDLFPTSKVICCVREVDWILDSVERLFNNNPTQLSKILNFASTSSVYARVEVLMNSDSGLIGQAWSTFREAWFGDSSARLLVIPYEKLCQNPAAVFAQLYSELDEPYYEHDFSNVEYDAPEFDRLLGTPGLHHVRGPVRLLERTTCLPPDIASKYTELNFWKKASLNARQVKIL
jgi:sulfotransferase